MSFEVFYRDEDLPADAQLVHLRGLRGVVWPPYCVKCGASASDHIVLRKVFRRRASGSQSVRDKKYEWHKSPWHYVIRKFRIPYCTSCIATYERIRDRVSAGRLAFKLIATPLIIPFIGAGFFALTGYAPLIKAQTGKAALAGSIMFAALILTMVISAFSSWRAARYMLVPRTNEITRACQPSDRLGWFDVGFHRIYAFENTNYASMFTDANRTRVWTAQDQARMQRRTTISSLALLGTIAVAGIWFYVFHHK